METEVVEEPEVRCEESGEPQEPWVFGLQGELKEFQNALSVAGRKKLKQTLSLWILRGK